MISSLEEITPGLTDRAVFVGQTGSGKTTLAKELIRRRRTDAAHPTRILVFDWKGTLTLPGFKRFTRLKKLVEANAPFAIYAPHYAEMDERDLINAFFKYAFMLAEKDYKAGRKTHTLVYVDEVYAVTLEGKYFAPMYSACMTRGREFRLSVWSATQLPVFVPSRILSESEHYYVFYLKNEAHRDKVQAMTGIDSDAIFTLPKRYFYYATAQADISPRITLNFRRKKKQ